MKFIYNNKVVVESWQTTKPLQYNLEKLNTYNIAFIFDSHALPPYTTNCNHQIPDPKSYICSIKSVRVTLPIN